MKRLLPLLLCLLFLLPAVLAQDYPQPQGYVSDYADIIDPTTEADINQLLTQLEADTTVEVAVLTVENLQGIDRETYAVEIFEEWGIGKRDINNGLLLLVALEEREYRFEVGFGLEGTIPDGLAGRIGRNRLVPNFQQGNYGQGILLAVQDIDGLVRQDPTVISEYESSSGIDDSISWKLPLAFFLATIIASFTAFIKKKRTRHTSRAALAAGFTILFFLFDWLLAFLFLACFVIVLVFTLGGGTGGGTGPIIFGGGFGGGFSGGRSGGFGGFGGGFSGGGGAGGSW